MIAGIDALLTNAGLPGTERPLGLRLVLALTAAAPALLWWLSPHVAHLPGFGWLADRRTVSLSLGPSGMRLRQGADERTFEWDDLSRVDVVDALPSAELVLRDGERVRLPGELVTARRVDGGRTTLLEEIERHRPDLSRLADRRRQARAVGTVLMVLMVALGLVGTYLLYR